MDLEWNPVELDPASDVTVAATTASFDDAENFFCEILRLEVTGTFREGSAGKPDAARLRGLVLVALAAVHPDVVLLDLRGLRYSWGDGILGVLQHVGDFGAKEPIEVVVLSSPENHGALASLLTPAGKETPEALQATSDGALELAVRLASARSRRVG